MLNLNTLYSILTEPTLTLPTHGINLLSSTLELPQQAQISSIKSD
jgi:hypothetical protein